MADLNLIKLTELTSPQGLVAYDIKEIEEKLGRDLYQAFNKWFAGKTGLVIGDKFCVYPHDWQLWVYLRNKAMERGAK